jgi:hypothetical protein
MAFQIIVKRHPDVKVIMTEYDMITKKPIRTLESLNFGKTSPGLRSDPVIIRMNVAGVTKIKDIRLGVLDASQNPNGTGQIYPDQSSENGIFGIEHHNSIVQKNSLSSFFHSLNTTNLPSDPGNVLIKNLTDNSSEYVYLNVKMINEVEKGYINCKWFFDFV